MNTLKILVLSFFISTTLASPAFAESKVLFQTAYNQNLVIKGVVIDKKGETLIGVNIINETNKEGTISDFNGNFTIKAEIGSILKVSCIGYKTQRIKVTSTQSLKITLEEDTEVLDEVVIVGYGTMKKSDVTGSIAVTKGEDMLKAQNFSALDNLRGKAAGVNIFSNSSQPGAYASRVLIRGMSTINSSSNPLYVVDGVVMEKIHLLNPNDIERMEVLKDASAAAIYGARGANGVIIVTTKRGLKDGKGTKISYQGSISMSQMARYMDTMNAQEWCNAFMQGLANENKYQGKNWSLKAKDWFNDPDYFDKDGKPLYDTNWQKEATRLALSHNHQINIQQGNEKSSIGAFLNYTDQQGLVKNTYSKRINAKLTYDANPTRWLTTNINLLVNHTWGRYIPETGGSQDARRTMIEMLPFLPVRDKNGNYTTNTSSTIVNTLGFEGMSNPVMITDLQNRDRVNTQIFGNAAFTFHLAEGLDLKTQLGIDTHRFSEKAYSSVELNNISKPSGWAYRDHSVSNYWQEETFLTYIKKMEEHRINVMLGLSWQGRKYDYDHSQTSGFEDDFYGYHNMGVGTNPNAPSSKGNEWTMNSYFLRAMYAYKDLYSVTATGRYDGSSKFGKNNKYAFFPSLGFAWNISNEEAMSDIESISNLKIHTSFGITGNSEIDPYSSLASVRAGTLLLNNKRASYSYISTMENPDLKWEKTAQWDIGVNLGLFNNRLNFDISYYNKKTTDLLLNCPLPRSTGFSSVFKNIGSVRNQGLDIMVSATPMQTKDFTWDTSLNLNYNKNKILALGDNNEDILLNGFIGGNTILRVGENMSSFYGYRRYGVYTEEDFNNGDATKSQIGRPKRSSKKEILGKGLPDWTGSFINTFRYKNLDLTLDIQFVTGVETVEQQTCTLADRFGITNGLKTIYQDAYNGENPNTMQPAIYLTNSGHAGQDLASDSYWVKDGSYIRGNLIQVGYTFSRSLCEKLHINHLRLFGSINNAFLICSKDFNGYDPESTSQGDSNQFGQNQTFYAYPRARTFTFGANITF